MQTMRNRIKYSQNFLKNSQLVKSLVGRSDISLNDTVYEIGAGEGIITKVLLEKAGKVVAFELDRSLFDKLDKKFKNNKSLELKFEDFSVSTLPDYPYKVFSNIPFNITSKIIKKLTLEDNPPTNAYLIVQKEAAARFAGKPLDNKNSQLSVILNPWFEFRVIHKFKAGDFFPKPSVEIVLLEIKQRNKFMIDSKNKDEYEDFVVYTFNQFKPNIAKGLSKIFSRQDISGLAKMVGFSQNSKPSELNFNDWVSLFNLFLNMPEKKYSLVKGSFAKQLGQQKNIKKISRTRIDKNWRQYGH